MILETLRNTLKETFPGLDIEVSIDERRIVTLRGECETWDQVVDAGHLAAKPPEVKNLVNELSVQGKSAPGKDYTPFREAGLRIGTIDSVDVLIIGTGVSGCGIARELSKYKLNILAVDQGDDVAVGATRANNGNIHPGHDVKPGTLKARLNVMGNRMYSHWAEELGFDLQRCGLLGAAADKNILPGFEQALAVAKLNGVDSPEIIDGERVKKIEGGFAALGLEPVLGIWFPSMGLVEPYRVTAALAENAALNGVRFLFNCTVADILRGEGRVLGAVTSRGVIEARYIINCAGVYADEISAMAGDKSYTIHPRKGVLAILDKQRKPLFASLAGLIGPVSVKEKANAESKGGGMCRTPEWNILMGPSATEVPDKEDLGSTPEDLSYTMALGKYYGIGYGDIIRFFTGSRPADYKEDFVIELSPLTGGFINVGGIQSPGLAAAPAIAGMVEEILAKTALDEGRPLQKNPGFNPIRQREVEFRKLSRIEQDELIRREPAYGRIVCRCESITEAEILAALRSPVPARSIDAVKRRTRAGMGRCQGGFCQCRVMEIMARELGLDKTGITLRGEGTPILIGGNRPGTKDAL
jgi:glycerol-3-phosphate dehydrogenase